MPTAVVNVAYEQRIMTHTISFYQLASLSPSLSLPLSPSLSLSHPTTLAAVRSHKSFFMAQLFLLAFKFSCPFD